MSNVTVGTNSWISVADAESYFKTRLNAWNYWNDDLKVEQKEAALVTAYKQLTISGIFSFPDDADVTMKMAQCEMALFLLQHSDDIDARKGLQSQGVESAGIVQETYDLTKADRLPIPAGVRTILKDYQLAESGFAGGDVSRDDCEDV